MKALRTFAAGLLLALSDPASAAPTLAVSGGYLGTLCQQGGQYLACPRDDATPSVATSAGYLTRTFSAVQDFSATTIDTKQTYASGWKWYRWNFFSGTTGDTDVQINTDRTVSVSGGNSNGQLASAAGASNAAGYVGTAFGGGGYFEAVLKFDPNAVVSGWPAWWTMALEHLALLPGQQWTGQAAGYSHFIEPDIFEYLSGHGLGYASTVHDWYGTYNVTCSNFCNVQSTTNQKTAPAGTDWTNWHKFGMLWVPATASINGSLTFYMDGVQQGAAVSYSQFTTQSPPPTTSTPWAWGVVDQQHLVLILGSGTSQMTVRSVNVWQADNSKNLSN